MNTANVSQLELGTLADAGHAQSLDSNLRMADAEARVPATLTGESVTKSPAPVQDLKPKSRRGQASDGIRPGLEGLLTFADAAGVLGISLRQFRRLVDAGKVAFVKVSERAPRVRPSELQRFLDASAVKYSEVQS